MQGQIGFCFPHMHHAPALALWLPSHGAMAYIVFPFLQEAKEGCMAQPDARLTCLDSFLGLLIYQREMKYWPVDSREVNSQHKSTHHVSFTEMEGTLGGQWSRSHPGICSLSYFWPRRQLPVKNGLRSESSLVIWLFRFCNIVSL